MHQRRASRENSGFCLAAKTGELRGFGSLFLVAEEEIGVLDVGVQWIRVGLDHVVGVRRVGRLGFTQARLAEVLTVRT
jgi:hypothetical protein